MNDLTQMFGEHGAALASLFAWLAGDRALSDKEYMEAHELIAKAVVNGDLEFIGPDDDPGKYDTHMLRDQLTPEQFAALQEEYELRQMGGRRN